MRTGLAALAVVAACDPHDPDELRSFTAVKGDFQYTAGGHGFDADGNLLLIGPEETVRWNRTSQVAERFGGPVDADSGRIMRDGAGNLFLHTGFNALIELVAGAGSTWTAIPLPSRCCSDPG